MQILAFCLSIASAGWLGYMLGCAKGKKRYLCSIMTEIKSKADDKGVFGDKTEYEEGVHFGLILAYQIVSKHKGRSNTKGSATND